MMKKNMWRVLMLAMLMLVLFMSTAAAQDPSKVEAYTRGDGKGFTVDLYNFSYDSTLEVKLCAGDKVLTTVTPRKSVAAGEKLVTPGTYSSLSVSCRTIGEAGSWTQEPLWIPIEKPTGAKVYIDGKLAYSVPVSYKSDTSPDWFLSWEGVKKRTISGEINGFAGFRNDNEGFSVELHNVVFAKKLELKVYSGGELLTVVENREGYVNPGDHDALTVSVRTGDEESTSWKQTVAWYPTNEEIPDTLVLYADGKKVDDYTLNLNTATWEKQEKRVAPAPEATPVPDASDLPQTGDNSNIALFAMLLIMSFACLLIVRRKVAER